jgi:hypothetical protein
MADWYIFMDLPALYCKFFIYHLINILVRSKHGVQGNLFFPGSEYN